MSTNNGQKPNEVSNEYVNEGSTYLNIMWLKRAKNREIMLSSTGTKLLNDIDIQNLLEMNFQ